MLQGHLCVGREKHKVQGCSCVRIHAHFEARAYWASSVADVGATHIRSVLESYRVLLVFSIRLSMIFPVHPQLGHPPPSLRCLPSNIHCPRSSVPLAPHSAQQPWVSLQLPSADQVHTRYLVRQSPTVLYAVSITQVDHQEASWLNSITLPV